MSTNQVQEGDKVSWSWNGNHPSGVASEIKPGDVTVVSHRGNEITKTGTKSDPAVHIERSGNDVVKTASELHVEKKGEQNGTMEKQGENTEEPKPEEKKAEAKGEEAQAGDKRKADEKAETPAEHVKAPEKEDIPAKEEPEAKKQKTNPNGAATNGNKKGPGRPKGGEKKAFGPKKEKKVPAVGKAARQTRSQGKTENEAL